MAGGHFNRPGSLLGVLTFFFISMNQSLMFFHRFCSLLITVPPEILYCYLTVFVISRQGVIHACIYLLPQKAVRQSRRFDAVCLRCCFVRLLLPTLVLDLQSPNTRDLRLVHQLHFPCRLSQRN